MVSCYIHELEESVYECFWKAISHLPMYAFAETDLVPAETMYIRNPQRGLVRVVAPT